MPKNAARAEQAGWLWRAAAIVLALTALRVALLAVTPLDLFVDEAQYWLWGQELAFGYYSKPPMIGWVIRAVTELAGSDAPFWVRLPGPLFHAATALILAGIAAGNGKHDCRHGIFKRRRGFACRCIRSAGIAENRQKTARSRGIRGSPVHFASGL